jgi:hypothetical protein
MTTYFNYINYLTVQYELIPQCIGGIHGDVTVYLYSVMKIIFLVMEDQLNRYTLLDSSQYHNHNYILG